MRTKITVGLGILFLLLVAVSVLAANSGADIDAETIKYNYKQNVTTFWGTKDKPVSIEVDKYTISASYLEYYQQSGKVVASGGVELAGTDPLVNLSADQIEADQQQVVATGSVSFDYGEFTGTAQKLTYLPDDERVVLEGNPVVTTASGEISGSRIEVDLAKGTMTALGGSRLHLDEVETR